MPPFHIKKFHPFLYCIFDNEYPNCRFYVGMHVVPYPTYREYPGVLYLAKGTQSINCSVLYLVTGEVGGEGVMLVKGQLVESS